MYKYKNADVIIMKRNYKLRKITALIAITLLTMCIFPLNGCIENSPRYNLDYCGQKAGYSNAKDTYKSGESVTLYYEIIATDTDYTFLLNGEPLTYEYNSEKGFEISFIMPDQDSTLECVSTNSFLSAE